MSDKIKAVLIDLSGTLHIDDSPTPDAVEALSRFQTSKKAHIKFVTNTTKESKNVLWKRLLRLGFNIEEKDIFSSLSAARKLIDDRKLRPFFMIDARAMEDFQGVEVENPNAVVIGLAPIEFSYEKMNQAMRLIHNGAVFIAIHKARYYKQSTGLALGPGPFVAALEYATDAQAEIVGKPSEKFFLSSIAEFGFAPDECVMLGDDVHDDIEGAQRIGMKGILIQTGKYRDGDEKKIHPPPFRVANNFSEAVKFLESIL